jgi:polyhydroxyalkanoic acid synthase PhaR subunit
MDHFRNETVGGLTMADQNSFDPYKLFKTVSDQWEKQANEMIHLWTNNREFVEYSKVGSDLQAQYLKMLQKNQELFANQLNLPTKKDLANVAKLSIQMEEKLDALEEQNWNLQESVDSTKKDMNSMVEISRDIMKMTKQLKTEQVKYRKELEKVSEIHAELVEVKRELAQIYSIKEEMEQLKKLMGHKGDKKAEQELELAVTSK